MRRVWHVRNTSPQETTSLTTFFFFFFLAPIWKEKTRSCSPLQVDGIIPCVFSAVTVLFLRFGLVHPLILTVPHPEV